MGSVAGPIRGEKVMKALFVRFLKDESGATAIEYGLIAAGIALAIIAILNKLGLTLAGIFTTLTTKLNGG
jgi:pilus assembly protein Flp/PilA